MADEAPLRLASIVGVDVAGYSARTEADSSATARQIVAMRTRIADVAARHHGRIFNTAGDGVMMEFTAASDAVEAIFDLLDERPAREPEAHIGAHLGDVTTTDNGDLLGHGVNVAARLMALAPAGRAVISQDLRAAAGSHAAGRQMRALGEVSLAKMQAKVHAFEIAPDTGAKIAADAAWRLRGAFMAVAAIVALALLAAFFVVRKPDAPPTAVAAGAESGDEVAAHTAAEPRVSIAVLPFVNMSSDPEQEYFSDGLSEELMNQLARIEALRVTARTSSFAFKGKNEDLRVIGEQLGVANVLEGSVRKSGERLRITAQLINVSDGSHLWSETYDRELSDVFAIQTEIATAVSDALRLKLGVGGPAFDYGGTKSFAAYDHFLKGRNSRAWTTEESIAHFRKAVEIDPDYAIAWANLSLTIASQQSGDASAGVLTADRNAAASRAIALAPNSRIANVAQGWCEALDRKWMAAEEAFVRAVERGIGDDPAAEGYIGGYLNATGRAREALAFRIQARDADPLAIEWSTTLTRQYLLLEMWNEFDAEYRRGLELEGERGGIEYFRVIRLVRTGADPVEITAQLEKLMAMGDPGMTMTALANTVHSPEKAVAALRETHERQPRPMNTRVMAFAGLYGATDLALDVMEQVTPETHIGLFQQFWYPQLSEARKDPRFKQIMRDVGLADFWLQSGKWPDFCGPDGADDFKCW